MEKLVQLTEEQIEFVRSVVNLNEVEQEFFDNITKHGKLFQPDELDKFFNLRLRNDILARLKTKSVDVSTSAEVFEKIKENR